VLDKGFAASQGMVHDRLWPPVSPRAFADSFAGNPARP
jgi:hypothetical protein